MFKGAIISAPMVKVPVNISPMTVVMGRILSKIAPKAGIVDLDPTGVSRDPEVVKTYMNDPLVFHGKTPARLSAEMLRAMQRLTTDAGKITLPIFILLGTGDKLVNPTDGQLLYDKSSSVDKTIKIYEGLYHEVHNEPERLTMFKDLEVWLKAHI
jgi:alpha-beta hydrolase superfamily lysophospholipase